MQFIVCCDKNWGIGYQGGMLFHLPSDLAFFKEVTYGHVIIMGRKTYLSLPGQKALPGRENIVLSKDESFKPKDALVLRSKEALKAYLKDNPEKKVFLLGGGTLYEELLSWCQGGYVTHVDKAGDEVDTYFPNLAELSSWKKDALMQTQNSDDLAYQIWHYKNTVWEEES